MVKVQVQVSNLAIDVIPGEQVVYKRGSVFDCPEERAKKLGNSVIIFPESEPEPEREQELPEIEPSKPPAIRPNKKRR